MFTFSLLSNMKRWYRWRLMHHSFTDHSRRSTGHAKVTVYPGQKSKL